MPEPVLGKPYSITRLSTFRQCPKRFWFKYVQGKKGAFTSVEVYLGRVVHKTLEWLHRQPVGWTVARKEALVSCFKHEWSGGLGESVRIIKARDSLDRQRARGLRMVKKYFEGTFVRDARRTIDIEHPFTIRLAKKYELTGVIDRIASDGVGRIHVIDFKTSKRGVQGLDDDDNLQLDAYGLWALLEKKVDHVYLTFEFLTDGARSTIDLKRSEANSVASELVSRIEEVRSEKKFKARPSPLCNWCEYQDVCPDRWTG